MNLIALFLGVVLMLFCLAVANNIGAMFPSWNAGLQELLSGGFLVLGIFGIIVGLFKK